MLYAFSLHFSFPLTTLVNIFWVISPHVCFKFQNWRQAPPSPTTEEVWEKLFWLWIFNNINFSVCETAKEHKMRHVPSKSMLNFQKCTKSSAGHAPQQCFKCNWEIKHTRHACCVALCLKCTMNLTNPKEDLYKKPNVSCRLWMFLECW